MRDSLVMLTNADAGGTSSEAVRVAQAELERFAKVEFRETSNIHDLHRVIDQLAGRALVVVGGDGSLHAAINALHDRRALDDVPLALIPLGTGNDFARSVGIPFDPAAAARVALEGSTRAQDLLVEADNTVVVNAVHLGVGAEAVRLGARAKGLLGKPGYPLGAALAGVRCRGWDLDVTIDGEQLPGNGRVLMVGVSVGRTIGGGTPLAPDAEPDDGLADVTVAHGTGAIRRLRFASRLRRGQHDELKDVQVTKAKTIAVVGDPIRANADGEVSGPRTTWQWSVRPRAWQLIHAGASTE